MTRGRVPAVPTAKIMKELAELLADGPMKANEVAARLPYTNGQLTRARYMLGIRRENGTVYRDGPITEPWLWRLPNTGRCPYCGQRTKDRSVEFDRSAPEAPQEPVDEPEDPDWWRKAARALGVKVEGV